MKSVAKRQTLLLCSLSAQLQTDGLYCRVLYIRIRQKSKAAPSRDESAHHKRRLVAYTMHHYTLHNESAHDIYDRFIYKGFDGVIGNGANNTDQNIVNKNVLLLCGGHD